MRVLIDFYINDAEFDFDDREFLYQFAREFLPAQLEDPDDLYDFIPEGVFITTEDDE